MARKAHSHTPYVIVLLAFLDKWKTLYGTTPASYKDKVRFREFVDEGRLKNEDGILFNEENFEEASKAVVKTIGVSKIRMQIPTEIQQLFDDPACQNLTIFSPKFWILVQAIRQFTADESASHLPVSGALPDMFSDTDSFVRVQNVYKAKADSDADIVHEKAIEICHGLGLADDFISLSEVKYYCRNAAFLRCVRTTPLDEEFGPTSTAGSGLSGYSQDDPQFRTSLWYVFLRAIYGFYGENGRLPGLEDEDYGKEAVQLKSCALKVLKTLSVSEEFLALATEDQLDKYAMEVSRFGGQQVHSVAAFVGGTAGQEVIKLITGQYIPLNSTLIYDAAACTTSTFQL